MSWIAIQPPLKLQRTGTCYSQPLSLNQTSKRFWLLCLFSFFLPTHCYHQPHHPVPVTILINPAGDAHTLGRIIDNFFERTLTFHYAQALQKALAESAPHITVLLSRKAGEIVPPLQNAHFANCLSVDLFISIHFYHETDIIPHLFIYTYKDSNAFIQPTDGLTFYPYHQAYLHNQKKTDICAQRFTNELKNHHERKQLTIHDPIHVPLTPLIGIISPALMIEIGIKKSDDWKIHIESIAQTLIALFNAA